MYQVSLEKFSGPLDILFSLIEEKKLAISEISLSQVADQFLEYLKNLSAEFKGNAEYQRILSDFLVIASRLILIKSRSLLPNLILSEEEEGDIKELEERLKIYQQIKESGRELGKWAGGRTPYLSRESYFNLPNIYGERSRTIFYPPKNFSGQDLLIIYETFLKTLPQVEKLEEKNMRRVVSLEEKIQELKNRIGVAFEASLADLSARDLFGQDKESKRTRIDVILTFLALLMLFRSKILEISQDDLFGDIKIKNLSSNNNG